MRAVMKSVSPRICEKVASGDCTILVSKTAPKCKEPFKGYIYATKAKKWFHSGIIVTSNELLWLSNDKIKMCDGLELWADGEDYQCVNGEVIGEFVCDGIAEFESEFHDDNSTEQLRRVWYDEDDGERDAELFAEDGDPNYLCTDACLTWDELKNYVGIGDRTFYGWHISDLKIYDKPKELSEFYKPCPTKEKGDCLSCDCLADNDYGGICTNNLTRAPSNWQYVDEL